MDVILESWQQFLAVFGTAMLPIVEVKGAIPLGVLTFALPLWSVFVVAIIGSSIPCPFILIFIEKLLRWLSESKNKLFNKAASMIINKVEKNKDKVSKFGYLAIFVFVAIPVPGTGVWTGSVLAGLLNLKVRYALPVIVGGNIVAALCMIFITHSINLVV